MEAWVLPLNLGEIRAIIYDLDGTVYDDTRHFELYAREIQAQLPEEVRAAFWADWEAAVGATHPSLRIGTLYDAQRDLVLEITGGQVERALQWDGSEVPPLVRQELYPGPVTPDGRAIMNVGDLWWVPVAVSHHYGGEEEKNQACFLHIRDVMADPAYTIQPIPGLADGMAALKGKVVQVLVTNSPKPDSEAILRKVGLLDLLDQTFFSSRKPAGFGPIVESLTSTYNITPTQILSVGDNLVNEIAPARAMGCQTALIDPHGIAPSDAADLVVPAMRLLLPELGRLRHNG